MSNFMMQTAARMRAAFRVPDISIQCTGARYASPFLAATIALALQMALVRAVGPMPPYLMFYPAVLISAILAGGGPGIIAIVVSSLFAAYWVIPPVGTFALGDRASQVSLQVFIGMNLLACALAETLRQTRRDKDAAQQAAATAHTAMQAEKEWLSRVLQSIADEVWLTDVHGRYSMANPPALREFGHETVAGLGVQAAIANLEVLRADGSPRPPGEAPPLRALAGEIVRDEEQIVRTPRSGELRHRQVSAAPVRDATGAIIGSVSVVRDITDRKRIEAALQEADRRKNVFLATLSHELRNPLAPIRTAARLLESDQLSHADLARCRRIISRQVAQMASLLDDLMDVSRIERGEITLKRSRVELRPVLEAAVETARPLIDARQHVLTLSIEPRSIVLLADPVRLTQVISNLLGNAAKYTETGGSIVLSAHLEADGLTVSVKDNGRGIEPHLFSRVFEMFTQVDEERPRMEGGLGIGLALAKSYVQLHGGRIDVASAGRGQGSEFTVTLPLALVMSNAGAGAA